MNKEDLNQSRQFRHELKYPISVDEANIICNRLKCMLGTDINAGESGRYNISSLYFDDIFNTSFHENVNGYDPREKIRMRIYNHRRDVISLECKRKERGKTLKESCRLSVEQANNLVAGGIIETDENSPRIIKKLELLQRLRMLKPVVIVEYERIPFVCKEGNVRITIDMNLTTSDRTQDFFNSDVVRRPVLPKGVVLLEVKYDSFLPDYIYRAVMLENLTQTAFSKYYLCRYYNLSGELGDVFN